MSMLNPAIQVGDIIAAYVPQYGNPGQPGDTFKKTLVLGLEVDPDAQTIEGVYVCRLSDRTGLVRNWDYFLDRRAIDRDGREGEEDFVLRTARVDLLPYSSDFFGPETFVYGRVLPHSFARIATKMQAGMDSHFAAESWGPRPRLDNTVVKTALGAKDAFKNFWPEDTLKPVQDSVAVAAKVPSAFAQQFELALRQLGEQTRQKAAELQRAFLQTRYRGHQNTPFQP